MSNEDIIRDELQSIANEAKQIYNASGKRVTGKWEQGIEINTSYNYGELRSYAYLAGRGRTKNAGKGETLQSKILQWIKDRGIRPIEEKMQISTLAFLIARKIHREGTDKSRHLAVFEKVLTPQRIQDIIDKVTVFNVELFVNTVRAELLIITKNV